MTVRFGPSGNSESFYEQGYKSTIQMPEWLNNMGLDAYEYQCTRGVLIKEETARLLGGKAKQNGIYMSIHAPYYINLSSVEDVKRQNSKRYIIESMIAADWMGAKRVIIHPGACSQMSRELALEIAKQTLSETLDEADNQGLGHIHICPETMGKINQLGTLDEVLKLCSIDERLIPTIDFGHIHARGHGCLKEIKDFERIFDTTQNILGSDRMKHIHIHFSRIEYTKGGEKKHWRLSDTAYGPEFEPLAEVINKKKLCPVIICESRGTMAEDALELKRILLKVG